ncbi:hypothetical protein [Streptomyces sp. H27-S2]|nr:hypothetical protein [Streptomyces sp. H27-S2]MCY0955291.1 hypothetical protein [Streptomyces sp. H27-S2]
MGNHRCEPARPRARHHGRPLPLDHLAQELADMRQPLFERAQAKDA